MNAGKSLKEQNAWLIRTALVVHAVAFAYVVFQPLPVAQFAEPGIGHKIQEFLAPGLSHSALLRSRGCFCSV